VTFQAEGLISRQLIATGLHRTWSASASAIKTSGGQLRCKTVLCTSQKKAAQTAANSFQIILVWVERSGVTGAATNLA
jgi:hypothetical protein